MIIHFVYACSFSQNNIPASPSVAIRDFYSKPESLTIVLLSKYIEQQPSYPWYSPDCCWKMLSLSDLVTAKLAQSRSWPNNNNNNKINDLILNLTPENVTQHSRIVTTTRKGSSTPTKMSKIIGRQIH